MSAKSNYIEIRSRFSSVAECGHQIKRGDTIGWSRKHGSLCPKCWAEEKANQAPKEGDRFDMEWEDRCAAQCGL